MMKHRLENFLLGCCNTLIVVHAIVVYTLALFVGIPIAAKLMEFATNWWKGQLL